MYSSDYFEFFSPVKIISGEHALSTLNYELDRLHVSKPLILTNQSLDEMKILDTLLSHLKNDSINQRQIIKTIPNQATIEIVKKASQRYKDLECDGIIALGGEAIIDTAKGINLMISEQVEDLKDLAGIETAHADMQPFIVIPTTSSTGSEAALTAVINDESSKRVLEFISSKLIPDLAVIDPTMTFSLPPRLTASTGVDALVHAVEAYTGLQTNPLSDAYAFAALKLIGQNLRELVKDVNNKKHRVAMNNAAVMAGISFSNSHAGIIHAVGDACEKIAGVSHGDALSVLLPHGMFYNLKFDYCRNSYQDILIALEGRDKFIETGLEDRALIAVNAVVSILNELRSLTGIPVTLKEIGVKRNQFDDIVDKAMHNSAILNSAGQVNREDIKNILEAAF
ncbi:iron-containing alcohol dehydrogenase [Halanaerobium congolense]|jgi:alcohol dehydrogenase|uniref:Alcohol dehydrogenase n=1 Tax=Halanaerobium congolense TaxID=54121 RepID=A0A1G6KYU2_9FIRM|nr:iron-containing alcohol dehydrogenase [Halanaerobium congolense]OEG63779.1 MAG: alcohol dehydrogenase [Halanaerobium sp. MDAL1]PXV68241.1 alcohol dehydrogenase [Halanaerobium congolense]TDP15596.1 alcohol dehydrogenase [Halanaerobium congolense]TDS35437.1 alcohol dehydrogenase [Halanaerobium congolense]TDX44507.1 alcohol dehydrogenase [Halanaerobium congolense]